MKDTKTREFWVAFLLIVVGCGLLIAGFVVPPLGAIHPSVLTAFGEVATFSGAIIGVDYHYRFKYRPDNNDRP